MKCSQTRKQFTASGNAFDRKLTWLAYFKVMNLDQRERAAVRVFVTGYILCVTSWYLAHLMVGR